MDGAKPLHVGQYRIYHDSVLIEDELFEANLGGTAEDFSLSSYDFRTKGFF